MKSQARKLVFKQRRMFALLGLAGLGMLGSPIIGLPKVSKPRVEVWKSPTCGCCAEWVKHLENNGFQVQSYDTGNTSKRVELGMPQKYASCHTALINGYVLEGHVPPREIQRLLRERPIALGLAVPEMPIGSPGMDGPEYGGQQDPFEVLLIQKTGKATVFAAYGKPKKGSI